MTNNSSCLSKRGKWIDEDNNIRIDCIDCGKETVEGNRCFECWEKAGEPWNWSCYDVGKIYKPKRQKGDSVR